MTEYFKVIENVSGYRVYHIPTDICPNRQTAREMVEDGDAWDYLDMDEYEQTDIDTIELVVEE